MTPRVLFLCSRNSTRSQMAEGFMRALGGDRFHVESAGTVAGGLHPLAIRVMAEVGIDISPQPSRAVEDLGATPFDVVITVCDASCPIPPRSKLLLRWRYPEPALAGGDEGAQLAAFRHVRDGIQGRVKTLVARLDRLGNVAPS